MSKQNQRCVACCTSDLWEGVLRTSKVRHGGDWVLRVRLNSASKFECITRFRLYVQQCVYGEWQLDYCAQLPATLSSEDSALSNSQPYAWSPPNSSSSDEFQPGWFFQLNYSARKSVLPVCSLIWVNLTFVRSFIFRPTCLKSRKTGGIRGTQSISSTNLSQMNESSSSAVKSSLNAALPVRGAANG